MKKILLSTILLIFACGTAQSQQLYQLSQYMINDLAYNPAISGSKGQLAILKASYRKQWAGGFGGDEPSTFTISGHSSVNESRSVGLGALIFADRTGPTRRTGFQFSYAYHLPINGGEQHLALGLGALILNYGLDFDKLELVTESDPAVIENVASKTTIDFNTGAYFYDENYWVGVSVAQLAARELQLSRRSDSLDVETVKLARHLFVSAGYRFDINEDFAVEPSILLKSVAPVKPQLDLNARVIFRQQYWAGISYRSKDAFALLLGLNLNNGFNATYSYDIITSGLNAVSKGSHEIGIGYNLDWRNNAAEAAPASY